MATAREALPLTGDDAPDPLALFLAPVAGWFRQTFGTPAPPQAQGWPVIARGEHALVLSPTGSGKTLTAFLWSLDTLYRDLRAAEAAAAPNEPSERPGRRRPRASGTAAPEDPPAGGIRVVYVSPLKALNNDIERNLEAPLRGIAREAGRRGERLPEVRVAVRTGDTPAADRRRMLRWPPHILITTPESLYLMLTAGLARATFRAVHTVIVDEIHTLAGTKRGAHLALTLERLERASECRLQRIGLSATIRPLENAARFLGGQDPAAGFTPRPVAIVDAGSKKRLDLRVVTPLDDFRDSPGNSIWTAIVPEVAGLIERHRTTLVFCNSRRLAERTADRLNEHRLRGGAGSGADSAGSGTAAGSPRGGFADTGLFAAGVDRATLEAAGLTPIRAHHGSMSKTARLEMETALKAGTLPALVATSSLELGIDIGEIDLVVHLQSPKSVAAGLQRAGRSGHLVGQTPKARFFPTFPEDVIEAAAVARGMLAGEIERTETPENPLDVLAQQIVAMAGVEDWSFADLFACVRGAYPYHSLSEMAFRGVLEMLAGKYPQTIAAGLRPRLSWDRVNDRITALPGTRLTAIRSGGTIPDRGMYTLVLGDRRTRIGELDEEFVYETRAGDTFLLGSQVWRAIEITDDRVVAEPAPGETPRMPFWRGDFPWRPFDLGVRIGAFRREVADLLATIAPAEIETLLGLDDADMEALCGDGDAGSPGRLPPAPSTLSAAALRLLCFLRLECALDRNSLVHVVTHLTKQLDRTGHVATDRTVVVERFEDAVGDPRIVVHSPFGGRVNGPWGIALAGALRERTGIEAQVSPGDDGILLRFADTGVEPPVELIAHLSSAEARALLLRELPASPVFGGQFRMNAARALLLPRESAGKRTPLWLSRLKAKDLLQAVQRFDDFPIVLETFRDCLRDVMDLPGLTTVLDAIERGDIRVVVHESERPSPLALGLDYQFSMRYMYEYDVPRGERALAALNVDRSLLADLLRDGSLAGLIQPEVISAVASQATRTAAEARARSPEELAQLLYDLGDLTDDEVAARVRGGDWRAWLDGLVSAGRVVRREIGSEWRWVSAERIAEYRDLRHNPLPVLRRYLAHAGPVEETALARRYGLAEEQVREALVAAPGEVIAGRFEVDGPEQWIDRRALEQMHRRTLTLLRREVRPVSLAAYGEFVARWHGVHADPPGQAPADAENGGEPLTRVLRQLRGIAVPGVAWLRDVLPARLPSFDPADLAARCAAGEVIWVAEGGREARRAHVRFFFRGEGGLFLDRAPDDAVLAELGDDAGAVLDVLKDEGAALIADVIDGTGLDQAAVRAALVELVLAGLVTNDTLPALHAVLGFDPPASRAILRSSLEAELAGRLGRHGESRSRPLTPLRWREARRRARETVAAKLAATAPATRGAVHGGGPGSAWAGRWSLVHRGAVLGRQLTDGERAERQARLLLDRWGVVTRASLEREAPVFEWEQIYAVLAHLEVRGEVRRGYFVEGLPGAQFALPDAVERLRAIAGGSGDGSRSNDPGGDAGAGGAGAAGDGSDGAESGGAPLVLNATDPAQLFGGESYGGRLRFARVPATAVAAHRGEPAATMSFDGDDASVQAAGDHPAIVPALAALARWWSPRSPLPGGRLKVTRWDGDDVLRSDGAALLGEAGFVRDGSAMYWTGGTVT